MIELRKKDKSREQNVYKTKGPDITTENIQLPVLRAMGGEELEEMDKGWKMIFELEWDNEQGNQNGESKVRGHEVDRWVRKNYRGVEQFVAREQYRGVTLRGVDYYSWEDTLTAVVSRSLSAGGHEVRADVRELLSLGEKREERVRTDVEEMKARDSEDQDQTVTHSPEMHPVLTKRLDSHVHAN
jgi:hypothetical protein